MVALCYYYGAPVRTAAFSARQVINQGLLRMLEGLPNPKAWHRNLTASILQLHPPSSSRDTFKSDLGGQVRYWAPGVGGRGGGGTVLG
jgi:hypothetical protein